MTARIPPLTLGRVLRKALRTRGLVREDDTALIFYDLDHLSRQAQNVQAAFLPTALHTVAVKACPLPSLLKVFRTLGFGAEAASLPEIYLALEAGVPPPRIVFDSPAKTSGEIAWALRKGVHVNADSLEELARIDAIVKGSIPTSRIGIRINPQVGRGNIALTSVGGSESKFGVPLLDREEELLSCLRRSPWVSGLHVHIGSQGCPLDLLVAGVSRVVRFAARVNQETHAGRITRIDIGGGLPVPYRKGDQYPPPSVYARALRRAVPDLFSRTLQVVTEFGRYLFANAGWVASRIEYVKPGRRGVTLITHVGADLFLRRCYLPDDWHHDIFATDASGSILKGRRRRTAVGGPLCFAGDMLARDLMLPRVESGDFLVIRDAGAYTLSMWSRYNSRQMPAVIGYDTKDFRRLKERESPASVVRFWM